MVNTKSRIADSKYKKVADFVNEFQKSCILKISSLCSRRKNAKRKNEFFGYISVIFCFICVYLLTIRLTLKLLCKRDIHILSVLSVLSSVMCLISAEISKKEAEKEKLYENNISFFENAVNESEKISKKISEKN